MIDRLIKLASFLPINQLDFVKNLINLFVKEIIDFFRIPIYSNYIKKRLKWKNIYEGLGIELHFSTIFNP